jgi:sulfur carrier protein
MPIVIKLNGKETELAEGTTVGELLDSRKIRREMVTVQVNGVIIDRNQFDTTPLKDGDEVEFLYYMGGGVKVVEQNDGGKPFGGLADGAGR